MANRRWQLTEGRSLAQRQDEVVDDNDRSSHDVRRQQDNKAGTSVSSNAGPPIDITDADRGKRENNRRCQVDEKEQGESARIQSPGGERAILEVVRVS